MAFLDLGSMPSLFACTVAYSSSETGRSNITPIRTYQLSIFPAFFFHGSNE